MSIILLGIWFFCLWFVNYECVKLQEPSHINFDHAFVHTVARLG